MAAPIRSGLCFCKHLRLLGRKNKIIKFNVVQSIRACSSQTSNATPSTIDDPATQFLDDKVQKILRQVTGFNLDKVYHTRQTQMAPPTYKLLTDAELTALQESVVEKAHEYLQIPPVMKPWTNEVKILSDDKEIDGHSEHRYMFTDITYGITDRSRTISVRESSGMLRLATGEEQNRLTRGYYPPEGHMYNTPNMFLGKYLKDLLGRKEFEYVLDRACVQFEPDDPEYHRVTEATYKAIDVSESFELLRSTRFFGGMAFYLTRSKRIDNLLVDMLKRSLLEDAASTVELFHILHPNCESAEYCKTNDIKDPTKLIKAFAEKGAHQHGLVELALQTCTLDTDEAAAASTG